MAVLGLRARGVVRVDGEGYQLRAFFIERGKVLVVPVGWSHLGGSEGGLSGRKIFSAWRGDTVGAVPAFEGAGGFGGEAGHFRDGALAVWVRGLSCGVG